VGVASAEVAITLEAEEAMEGQVVHLLVQDSVPVVVAMVEFAQEEHIPQQGIRSMEEEEHHLDLLINLQDVTKEMPSDK
jgi:hypothetical protein